MSMIRFISTPLIGIFLLTAGCGPLPPSKAQNPPPNTDNPPQSPPDTNPPPNKAPLTPSQQAAKSWLIANLPTLAPAHNLGALLNNPNLTTRWLGVSNLKYTHPTCYFAYAEKRLGGNQAYEKLEALERTANPRPLAFADDAQWISFRTELADVFQSAGYGTAAGRPGSVVIIGTSTTFFSLNPLKGSKAAFTETPPQCIQSANNPATTNQAYAFDSGGQNTADIDVHVFIKSLSETCKRSYQAAFSDGGNTNNRGVYFQNTLALCFSWAGPQNPAPAQAQAMRDPVKATGLGALGGNRHAWKTAAAAHLADNTTKFGDFMKKWETALGREINISVHVLPQDIQPVPPPWYTPGSPNDFAQNPYLLHTKFAIPIP